MKKLILPILATILLSVVTTYFIVQSFKEYSIHPSIENTIDDGQVIKQFVIWLVYFSALIVLPFLIVDVWKKFGLQGKDWWKTILYLEVFVLVFSYVATPPDFVSTIMFFILCQPIVVVNSIVLKKKMT